nr:MAG TPA: hypothetical protein [Caudoviricetes sp.]
MSKIKKYIYIFFLFYLILCYIILFYLKLCRLLVHKYYFVYAIIYTYAMHTHSIV